MRVLLYRSDCDAGACQQAQGQSGHNAQRQRNRGGRAEGDDPRGKEGRDHPDRSCKDRPRDALPLRRGDSLSQAERGAEPGASNGDGKPAAARGPLRLR